MTNWTDAIDLLDERDQRGFMSRVGPGALAFALSAALGVWLIYLRPMSHSAPVPEVAVKSEANPFGGLTPVNPPAARLPAAKAGNPFGGLVVQGFGSTTHFEIAEREVPLPPVPPTDLRSQDDGAPLPPRRPSDLNRSAEPPPSSVARLETPAPLPTPSSVETPSVFGRLFGGASPAPGPAPAPAKTPEPKLAYAAPPPPSAGLTQYAVSGRGGLTPGGGGFGGFLRGLNFGSSGSSPTARFGDRVAVYDISAKMVYLPDGSTIEAHSGLGDARDDPSKVNERMRGPTPPATYALTPRGDLFHGVAALRLTPVDSNVYGRAGLLAHTYMLGPNGDSNGCVSFRDYDAFLRAFRSGQVSKLVVVTRL
jgi:hypothetical protein